MFIFPTTTKPNFRLDLDQVQEVADLLGLQRPIAFYFTARNSRSWGSYCGSGLTVPYGPRRRPLATPHHFIALNPRMADSAGHTVAHEMVHAWQCETEFGFDHNRFFTVYNEELRALRAFSPAVRGSSRGGHDRYKSQRHEAEADAWADDITAAYTLTTLV